MDDTRSCELGPSVVDNSADTGSFNAMAASVVTQKVLHTEALLKRITRKTVRSLITVQLDEETEYIC